MNTETTQPTGFYRKFDVTRIDGRDKPGGDRENAEYFILDLGHDPHALAGLRAYVDSLRESGDYPDLVADLTARYPI